MRTCEAAGGVGCAVVESQCVSSGGKPDTWSGSESVLAGPEDESDPTADAVKDEGVHERGAHAGPAGPCRVGGSMPVRRTACSDRARGRRSGSGSKRRGLEATGYLSREETEVLAAAGAREQAASRETEEPDESGNQVIHFAAAGPRCAELGSYLGERSAACWQETHSLLGCYLWNELCRYDHIADWTGECSGDTAHGSGSRSLSSGSEHLWTAFGSVMHCKRTAIGTLEQWHRR